MVEWGGGIMGAGWALLPPSYIVKKCPDVIRMYSCETCLLFVFLFMQRIGNM